jgi:hypothetical protein
VNQDPAWKPLQTKGSMITGVTQGCDPRDFLRTATRASPYPLVRQLWAEKWQAEEWADRIQRP